MGEDGGKGVRNSTVLRGLQSKKRGKEINSDSCRSWGTELAFGGGTKCWVVDFGREIRRRKEGGLRCSNTIHPVSSAGRGMGADDMRRETSQTKLDHLFCRECPEILLHLIKEKGKCDGSGAVLGPAEGERSWKEREKNSRLEFSVSVIATGVRGAWKRKGDTAS